ncbi:DUF1700 domain-containing protein [Virgibacillus dakarensis]|uniref:DUF1700 domain-containing protein n=1 Tax=Lentibacillus populi TaxID=1827502 RepID=A0A9W5TZS2_9BACI|nr:MULTISPECIES: DUF1700 domain-containing protein [Bacillaceae]MBT2217012.1 DUF1700 domain-containing protein [Virgibacillus dakarensis]MTW86923.1 DUF1700 domain-containing protein [Virgibacillus dakarensis]GGB52521.1 hypothetical protein GCM10011409_32610 [Lentibacillus populi]
MTEKQFMDQLNASLKKLSTEEKQDILQDYQEHFAIGKAEGKTEEQIADALGSPNKIARELLAMYHLEKAETNVTAGNMFRAVWAGIGLGFFNLIIVLGPFIALLAVVAAGWVIGLAFSLSPLLVLINVVIYPGSFVLFDLFASIALCGLGLLITIGMYHLTNILTRGFIRYLKLNTSLVKGGLTND